MCLSDMNRAKRTHVNPKEMESDMCSVSRDMETNTRMCICGYLFQSLWGKPILKNGCVAVGKINVLCVWRQKTIENVCADSNDFDVPRRNTKRNV